MNPDVLVDTTNFCVGFRNYVQERPGAGIEDPIVARALKIFNSQKTRKKILDILSWMGPFLKENSIGYGLPSATKKLSVGNFLDPKRLYGLGVVLGRFLRFVLRNKKLRDLVFGANTALTRGRQVATASDGGAGGLATLAKTPCPVRIVYKWVRDAAKSLGVEPPPDDQFLADLETAQLLGKKLNEAKQEAIHNKSPESLERAQTIQHEIDQIAQASVDPKAIWQAALNTHARQASSYVLEKMWGPPLP